MSEPSNPARTAVVLGGSHAGMLAARALAGLADRVVVIERDVLPDGPAPRKGLPQARHAHMLWSGGVRAVEELLPGVTDALRAAGARRTPVTTDMVVMGARGWFRRWPESHHVILAGRDLLDATIRAQVLADDRIELLSGVEVLGLEGDAGAVTGVRVRAREALTPTAAAALNAGPSGGSRTATNSTAGPVPGPGPGPAPESDSATGANAGAASGAASGARTGTGTRTSAGTGTGAATGASAGTGTGAGAAPGVDAGVGPSPDSGAGAASGAEWVVSGGLVVDATGRGSRAGRWLKEFGLPAVERREVDAGLAYASRLYRAPEQARSGYPVVNVQPDPRENVPGRAGFLLPIEDGHWIVTLNGTRGGEPSTAADDFVRFAREELRHPVIGELLEQAEPVSDVSYTRATVNRRHFYERMPAWPENFVVVGDALAAYNPLYGHGLAVAAQSAVILRDVVRRQGWAAAGLSRRAQKAVARPVSTAWDLAVGQDVFCEGATEHGPTLRDRMVAAYVGRLMLTATGNGRIARRVTDVTSLERGPAVLLTPSVLLAAAVGPLRPALAGPPLTGDELKRAGLE